MMPIRRPRSTAVLSSRCRADLERRQGQARKLVRRGKGIKPAWDLFGRSQARRELVAVLDEVFDGKCAYCEQIVARDVEHFYPKVLYPKRMFQWSNLLRACKNCNTDKLDRFPLRRGKPVLLDPCRDEPTNFFRWDERTGMPVSSADPDRAVRAVETIRTFGLRNQALCEERRDLARRFVFLLLQATEDDPNPPDVEEWLLDLLNPRRPWRSVLRQIVREPEPRLARVLARVRSRFPALVPALDLLSS
jgi:uncharacterized protein (TIGR02646 family)